MLIDLGPLPGSVTGQVEAEQVVANRLGELLDLEVLDAVHLEEYHTVLDLAYLPKGTPEQQKQADQVVAAGLELAQRTEQAGLLSFIDASVLYYKTLKLLKYHFDKTGRIKPALTCAHLTFAPHLEDVWMENKRWGILLPVLEDVDDQGWLLTHDRADSHIAKAGSERGVPKAITGLLLAPLKASISGDGIAYYPQLCASRQEAIAKLTNQLGRLPLEARQTAGMWAPTWNKDPYLLAVTAAETHGIKL